MHIYKRKYIAYRPLSVVLLCLIALVIRITAAHNAGMIAKDGIKYLRMAEQFSQGRFHKGLAEDFHPLYPLLIAPLYPLFSEPERAGQFVSVVLGTLTLLPIYFLGLKIFNFPTAAIASLLFACHPYLVRTSAEVLSEAVYIFFYAVAIALGWQALTSKKYRYFFLASAAGSLAYLVRPEGLLALFILALWLFVDGVRHFRRDYRRKLAVFASMGLAFFLLAFPYMVYLKIENGSWMLTKKKSLKTLIGLDQAPEIDTK
jgi:asparagine N-glycosylation enzyme membrane subunit Stt3